MDLELATILAASVISTIASVWAGAKALQSAYRSAVNKRAAEIEMKRLADQSKATVVELQGEVSDLRAENTNLWTWLEREREKVEELRGRLDAEEHSR